MSKAALRAVVLIGCFAFTATAWAEVSLEASLDKTEGSLEDVFELAVVVSGGADSNPDVPVVDGLAVESMGTSQQIQIINGQMSRKKQYTYMIRAKRAGTFTIPPITVRDGNGVVASGSLTLRVGAAAEVTPHNRKIFLSADVSKQKVYVGEQILYRLGFYRKISTTSAELTKPSFEGFAVEEIGKQKDIERVVAGERYLVTELHYALFPTRPGTLHIDPAKISFEAIQADPNDPFARFGLLAGGRRVAGDIASAALTIEALPVPDINRPKDYSGLVGKFELRSELSKTALQVGDSATMTVAVRGRGNVRQIPDLAFPDDAVFQSDFKVYDDKPVLSVSPSPEGMIGEKVLKKALVPRREGPLTVPALTLSYFDTDKGQYITLKTTPYELAVAPGKGEASIVFKGDAVGPAKKGIQVLGEDLLPIRTKLKRFRAQAFKPGSAPFLAATFSPPIIFLLLWGIQAGRKNREENVDSSRRKKAFKETTKLLAHAEHGAKDDPRGYFGAVGKALRFYVGEKLGIAGQALTPQEAAQAVQGRGAPEMRARELEQLLRHCEEFQFGGGSGKGKSDDVARIEREARSILGVLEKCLRVLVLAILLFGASTVWADDLQVKLTDPQVAFSEGVAAYQRGDYPEATRNFEAIVAGGEAPAEVSYNLGNAYYRQGKLGQAIAAYLTAEKEMPRDDDLHDNLQFVRKQTQDKIEMRQREALLRAVFFWVEALTAREWFFVFLFCNLALWSLAAVRLFRKNEILGVAFWVFAALTLATLSVFLSREILAPQHAVITQAEVPVYSGPGTANTQLFRLHEGAELRLRDEDAGWVRLTLLDGKQGWVEATAIARVR